MEKPRYRIRHNDLGMYGCQPVNDPWKLPWYYWSTTYNKWIELLNIETI